MSDAIRQAQAQQLEFVKVEVESGLMFVRLAASKMEQGSLDEARRELELAQEAYYTALKYWPKVAASKDDRRRMDGGLQNLRQALDEAESRISEAPLRAEP